MSLTTTTRNASLEDLAALLKDQHARKVDVVAPATMVRSDDGVIVVSGADAQITDDGVTTVDGRYLPTAVFDEGLAEKLQIPIGYVKRMRADRPDLYDANVNGWLHGGPAGTADPRKFLLRGFKADDGETTGIGRAFLSDTYKRMDNLDVLMATLDGVKQAGVDIQIDGCDLTERRMRVRIIAPEVFALAPTLLNGYRSPFDQGVDRAGGETDFDRWRRVAAQEGMGYAPGTEPVVFAGFDVSNSETGGGAFTIVPRIVIKVCKNGLTLTGNALRAVHLGSKMDAGIVQWSDDTEQRNLALVTAKARDAVATFLDADYVAKAVAAIDAKAGAPLATPAEDVKTLGKRLQFDEATIDGVLDHFIRGGQMTAGGVVNAITSYAQVVDDADKSADIEGSALKVLELVG